MAPSSRPLLLRLSSVIVAFVVAALIPSPLAMGRGNSETMSYPMRAPRLVLVIAIDQFRSDYLTRFHNRFLPARGKDGAVGGFRYLMERGTYIPYGTYDLLQNMTGPGHATMLTGSYPYRNGIALNDWYTKGMATYCVEDPAHKLVGPGKADPHGGTSPRNLIGSTVGDELKNAGHPSRVVAIALKDRAAILLGGHRADLALWLDSSTTQWVSSDYYLKDKQLPQWVAPANEDLKNLRDKKITWELPDKKGNGLSTVWVGEPKAKSKSYLQMGLTFPHTVPFGSGPSLAFPVMLDHSVALAERAVSGLKLGNGTAPDVLAISFSSFDYLGHMWGPNSREMEEMTVAADAAIARLLRSVSRSLPNGLNEVTVVLTGDHGASPMPEYLNDNQMAAGRIEEGVIRQLLEDRLASKFGTVNGGYTLGIMDLNIFFNWDAIRSRRLDEGAVLGTAKRILQQEATNIAEIILRPDAEGATPPRGAWAAEYARQFYPGRSGDIVMIPQPFFFSQGATTNHMTSYSYDRLVPIIFTGHGIRAGKVIPSAHVVDIAPTLSALLGVLPPALSEGQILEQALALP